MFSIYTIIVFIVAIVLIGINWLLAKSTPNLEKDGPFECGFTSFQQTRTAFSVSFILIAILFLPFDLEISSILPYGVTAYTNGLYGLTILILFLLILIIAFVLEVQLGILHITRSYSNKDIEIGLYKKEV
uniref:NADH-ubiquinone oxidoreductase chain 3 n=1 Tax=Candida buenavistaensis TaxID=434039 RepID=S5U4N0_9ASCO|nr:NADH dehydrogenase subunit 3 [Candida buenavistaensis]AGS44071.1 NADH dehydrogenase subunit 3 [Candida buenavistaensis]